MRIEDLSYAAGIIDGEGSITISKNKDRKTGVNYPSLHVQVETTDLVITFWLQRTFGGGITPFKSTRKATYKTAYYWYLSGDKSVEFLKLILPYLKLKKERAELAITFQKLKHGNQGCVPMPRAVKEAQFILKEKMSVLNS